MYLLVVVFIGLSTHYPNSGFNYTPVRMSSKETCEVAAKKILDNTTVYTSPERTRKDGSIVPICMPIILPN